MFKLGLCSVTFRNQSVEEIIQLVKDAKLNGIEWGGDVHVPPGDLKHAKKVKQLTREAGLEVTSYGSYYRVGEYEKNADPFATILSTAVALKAPSIRIWAGTVGSDEADLAYRKKVIDETRTIATMAAQEGVLINFEYHGNTLTDTMESAALLMKEVDHPNVKIYWQPAVGQPVADRLASIENIYPWLTDVHVFHWDVAKRLPLAEGKEEWEKYLARLSDQVMTRYLFLEFVKEDSNAQFFEDALVLKDLVNDDEQKNRS